ncbi:hypothetical protein pneo_cds_976 [Pandoravirus neocaledonia]|uniref:Ankyrin repeat domain containing protein n=1 Tax=Pandoravirus neocaledonia TaxID=2107708 RepID=A0A2U7UDS4_9VIRU|nr:hypothetical protein pneo_cds_976 [Pandoravirus neocaledonia]AVK76583.1 hypothetical protein pneo_cds_976 [Pandoravirus neocaledonia]
MNGTKDDSLPAIPDLPVEILVHIVSFLRCPRHVVACAQASPLLSSGPTPQLIEKWLRSGRFWGVVACGAPLDVVAHLHHVWVAQTTWDIPPTWDNVHEAARGGRLDVVRFLFGHAEPRRGIWGGEYKSMKKAVQCALDSDNADLLMWLLANCPFDRFGRAAVSMDRMAMRAACRGRMRIIERLHEEKTRRARGRRCGCARSLGLAAVRHGHVDILCTLSTMGCTAVPTPSRRTIEEALDRDQARVIDWIGKVNPAAFSRVSNASMVKAACVDRHHALDRMRFWITSCAVEVLVAASKAGMVEFLSWAVGDGSNGASQRQDKRDPIPSWDGQAIAYAAALSGCSKVIRWMLQHPVARNGITVGVARCALVANHINAAVVIHDAGAALFNEYDALTLAVRHGGLASVRAVADRGGICDVETIVSALDSATEKIVMLCARYGTDLVQPALDRVAGRQSRTEPLIWLRNHVPGICLAERHSYLTSKATSSVPVPRCRCRCCCEKG